MTNWLKRSGIQKNDGTADRRPEEIDADRDDGVAGEGSDTPEVKNDKATPVVGDERGIPSVNQRTFRSRALPLSFAAIALAAVGVVWLIPSPQTPAPKAKDDPRATKDQRFDENRPSAVLAPTTPPLPPEPPQQLTLAPRQPASLATPSTPIQIVPAPDPRAAPKGGQAAPAAQRPLTPLERRQQSKVLIVGAAEKGDMSTTGAAPTALPNNPDSFKRRRRRPTRWAAPALLVAPTARTAGSWPMPFDPR